MLYVHRLVKNFHNFSFFLFRNPNEPQEPDLVHGVRQERNRFKNIEWTAYEAVHKKYLNLGKSKKIYIYAIEMMMAS